MSLREDIQAHVKDAMKARDKLKLTTLRGLLAEVKKAEIDTKSEFTDEQVITAIQKEIKKRRDAIGFAVDAGRAELVEQNEAEVVILTEYLGAQLSADELRTIITELVASGADQIGKIMGPLNQKYKGQFEGKVASEIAREVLG